MKLLIITGFIAVFATMSCSKLSKTLKLKETTYGGCFEAKSGLKAEETSPEPHTEEVITIEDNGETLMVHVAVYDNCCGDLQEEVEINKEEVNINLINKGSKDNMCYCTCDFSYDFEFEKNKNKATVFNVYHQPIGEDKQLIKTVHYGE